MRESVKSTRLMNHVNGWVWDQHVVDAFGRNQATWYDTFQRDAEQQ